MNSLEIKHALMYYFRFKRQWICASECLNSDVMAITGKDIIEVEVKINKYDLWKGEAKKSKHKKYKNLEDSYYKYAKIYTPTKFYICVPNDLEEEAKKWVVSINDKYGIIICTKYRGFYPYSISILKKANRIHNVVNEELSHQIMKRVCSENIGLIEGILRKNKS